MEDSLTSFLFKRELQESRQVLQRRHDVTLGWEERIAELKREVNQFLTRLGKPAKYPSREQQFFQQTIFKQF